MSYRKSSDTLKKVAAEYKADTILATEYISTNGMITKLGYAGVDGRDLVPMLAVLGIESKKPKEREAEIKSKMDLLVNAFLNPDHSARKPYLDLMYDMRDSFDPDTVDINNEGDVRKLLQCMMLSQTFAEKAKENPDYYNNRYATPQERRLADANGTYIENAVMYAKHHLETTFVGWRKNKTLDIRPGGITFHSPLSYIAKEIYDCTADFAKTRRDQAREELDGKEPSNVYEVPILWNMLPHAGKDVQDIQKYNESDSTLMGNHFSFVIHSGILKRENKNMQGLNEANFVNDMDSVYIDGMPFAEFREKNFPGSKSSNKLNSDILSGVLLNPDHRVDIVHSYRGEDGQMKYEAKTLKPIVTPEQEAQYMNQFSWIRRTLFNWGPFRIVPLKEAMKEKLDMLDKVNTDPKHPEVKERYEKICTSMKERVETAIAERLKKKREEELANRHTYEKENDRMHAVARNTLRQLEKQEHGAACIMANQVADSCEELMNRAKESPTYESVAEILARQVLFAQIVAVRTSSFLKMGELERALVGDTDEATRERIETAVQTMAKDPVLKENFCKMAGITDMENPVVDEACLHNMYAAGGYKELMQQYNAQKGISLKKTQPAPMQANKALQQDARNKGQQAESRNIQSQPSQEQSAPEKTQFIRRQ